MKFFKNKKEKSDFRFKMPAGIELVLVFLIAITQVSLIGLSNASIDQVSDISHYTFTTSKHATDEEVLKNLENYNLDFRPNACKMISIYTQDPDDSTLQLRLRFVFMRTPDKDLVHINQEFREYVMTNEQGYRDVDVGDNIEHVFFRWIDDPHGIEGARDLVVVRVNQPTYFFIWLYPLLSCIDVILIFGLIIIIMLKRRQEGIDQYMALSNDRRYM